jgi:hypothetical protein
MVGAAGIEPATVGLEIRCSIRLSYAPARTADFILPAVGVIPNSRIVLLLLCSAVIYLRFPKAIYPDRPV